VSDYTEFFLNCLSSVVQLDCLEISHSAFSATRYLVRNATAGVTVTHEDASSHPYIYVPMELALTGPRDDLDHILQVRLGDLGEIIGEELDNIAAADGFSELPTVVYRTYRSDDLTAPLYGPINLELKKFSMDRVGCSFEAKAPSLNISRTGEGYTLPRFPMLRGLM
jgi:hypothetical protein